MYFRTEVELKRFSERYWNKTETGDSQWKGDFSEGMYCNENKDRKLGIEREAYVSGFTHRRYANPHSDHDKTWFDFNLDDCYRVDMDFSPNYEDVISFGMGPTMTIKEIQEATEPEEISHWNSNNFDKKMQTSTPLFTHRMWQYGNQFVGGDFSWMYKNILMRFFLEKSVIEYDITKTLPVDWPVPPFDEVWINPEKPKFLSKPKPIPEKEEEGQEGNEKPVPDPLESHQGPEELLPLLEMAEEDARKSMDELKDCLEEKRRLIDEKNKLCEEYDNVIGLSLLASEDKHKASSMLFTSSLTEAMETLRGLLLKYQELATKPGSEVQNNLLRLKNERKQYNLSEISGPLPDNLLTTVGGAPRKCKDKAAALFRLHNFIKQMKTMCNDVVKD